MEDMLIDIYLLRSTAVQRFIPHARFNDGVVAFVA